MLKTYFSGTALRRLGLVAGLLGGAAGAAQAQLSYTAASSATLTGTYTDLGTNGVAIATANTDDANSSAQDIGFSFTYNGTAFTQFVLNTNGLLRLGANAPSTATASPTYGQTPETGPINSTNAADVNLLMPFNFDLTAGTATPEYRVATTGTAGSRVCTIQWKNVADKAVLTAAGGTTLPTQFTNFSFQVKLYETSNQIDFVYSSTTVGTSALKYAVVGLKGSGNAAGQDLLAVKASSADWSTTTFYTGPQQTATLANAHNFRATYPPDAGRTYRFAPVPASDAAVSTIYTYGKLATPAALPHAVQAVITNVGTSAQTNLVATLAVTGANTFNDTQTIASLAPGASATVTFASYPATLSTGTNTVSVSVPTDGNAANNSATYTQLVSADRISYTNPGGTTDGSVGISDGSSPGGALAAKYALPAATALTDVTLSFEASTSASTTYQVILYDATGTGGTPGTVLYTSPTQTRTAAASTPIIALPSVQVPATFYVGVKELDNNLGLAYQTEDPLRPATYYYSLNASTGWTSVNSTPLRTRLGIEFGVAPTSCAAPTAVAVSNVTTNSAAVSFTPAASGVAGYQVVYGPTGFNPTSAGTTVTGTASPITLTGLASATNYQVYVRSSCTGGGYSLFTSAASFTTACDPGAAVAAAAYSQNFDVIFAGQSLPCGITVLDANNDGATWSITRTSPSSGPNAIRYTSALSNSQAANDWFFTPPLITTAGARYQVAFRYRGEGIANTTSPYTERLEVKAGSAATAAGQTTTLYTNTAITNTNYALANGASTPAVAVWQPGAGTQYLGFHAISAATQGNLYLDDLSISSVLATSEVLVRAVTVFPNPSATGLFDLDVHGANAKGPLEVQVTNALGQVVYSGTARDNYTNHLDLSTLASGLYHLQVRSGNDLLTRQVSIVR